MNSRAHTCTRETFCPILPARLALRLREACGTETSALERFLPALLSAEPETMRCFLFKVRDKFGSVPEYLEQLGVASTIAFIRAALVEPPAQA